MAVEDLKFHELEAVEARIRVAKQLLADQELRIERLRKLGADERPSIKLLEQLKFSLDLLTNTRSSLLREIQGLVPS